MPDYFELAKHITRHHWPTMAEAQWKDGYKPRCRFCFVPVDPRSREYHAMGLCTFCYAELPPIQTQHKSLLPIKETP